MASTGVNNGTLTGIYVAGTLVSKGTSHSISIGQDTFDITSKDSNGWKEIKQGLRNWSLSGEFKFAEDSAYGLTDFFALLNARTSLVVKFTTNVSGDKYYSGTTIVTSIEKSSDMEDAESYSISLEGTGALVESTLT